MYSNTNLLVHVPVKLFAAAWLPTSVRSDSFSVFRAAQLRPCFLLVAEQGRLRSHFITYFGRSIQPPLNPPETKRKKFHKVLKHYCMGNRLKQAAMRTSTHQYIRKQQKMAALQRAMLIY
jgi:hypothetical protein